MNDGIVKYYKTKDLNWWQKLFQAYWVMPNSWLLDEFIFDGKKVIIKIRNGKEISANIEDLEANYSVDKYYRREFKIKTKSEKIRFKEIPYMLKEEQWDEICEILNAEETVFSKLTHTISDSVDDISDE